MANEDAMASMTNLPQELLDHVFRYLDSPPPSMSTLKDEPVFEITRSPSRDYKNASLVCHKWRKSAIAPLFRNVCLLKRHTDNMLAQTYEDVRQLLHFLQDLGLASAVQSLVICLEFATNYEYGSFKEEADIAGLWETVFTAVDPLKLTIVAPPYMLGAIIGLSVPMEDAWVFDMHYHTLHLSRKNTSASLPEDAASSSQLSPEDFARPPSCLDVFGVRPWSSVLLNEGSFIKVFHAYEYFQRQTPSILAGLVGFDMDRHTQTPRRAVFPKTATVLSYIATFPTHTHFQLLPRALPRLERFYMQITPRNDILQDRALMQRIDANDLWMERNHCYSVVMRELFSIPPAGNFKYLEEFESGDAADEDAWNMAVQFVEHQGGWTIESPGVFVRSRPQKEKSEGEQLGSTLSVPHLQSEQF